MYKYTFGVGTSVNVKTPEINSLDDVKKEIIQTADGFKAHFEYPNGLILDTEIRADKIEYISNKRIILLEDGTLGFED